MVHKKAARDAGSALPIYTGTALTRKEAFAILQRITQEANAHLLPDEHIHVSLDVHRHMLLRKVANEKEVHYAMKRSGHRGDRYIWRYVQLNAQSLADTIDELD